MKYLALLSLILLGAGCDTVEEVETSEMVVSETQEVIKPPEAIVEETMIKEEVALAQVAKLLSDWDGSHQEKNGTILVLKNGQHVALYAPLHADSVFEASDQIYGDTTYSTKNPIHKVILREVSEEPEIRAYFRDLGDFVMWYEEYKDRLTHDEHSFLVDDVLMNIE